MYKENGIVYLTEGEHKSWRQIDKELSKSSTRVFKLSQQDISFLHRVCKTYDKDMIYDEWGKYDHATNTQINVSLYHKIHNKVKVDKRACKHHFGALAKVAVLWGLLCLGYLCLKMLSA